MTQHKQPNEMRTWDEWMPPVRLKIPIDQFRMLPRNPAYKYEYVGGHALLSPRPRHFHGMLTFSDYTPPLSKDEQIRIRPLKQRDMEELPPLFSAAFQGVQPFAGLTKEERQQAARESLTKTYTGRDGPLLESACFTAMHTDGNEAVGAILITQVLGGDPSAYDSYRWPEIVPLGDKGQPHLTWIFVASRLKGRGVGSALLAAAVAELAQMGHHELWSTFLLGNDSSVLWHWRNGFRLVPYEFSKREIAKG